MGVETTGRDSIAGSRSGQRISRVSDPLTSSRPRGATRSRQRNTLTDAESSPPSGLDPCSAKPGSARNRHGVFSDTHHFAGTGEPLAEHGSMFVRQAAVQFELWTGQRAPLDVMRRVLEDRL